MATVNGKEVKELGPEAVKLHEKWTKVQEEAKALQTELEELKKQLLVKAGQAYQLEQLLLEIAESHDTPAKQ